MRVVLVVARLVVLEPLLVVVVLEPLLVVAVLVPWRVVVVAVRVVVALPERFTFVVAVRVVVAPARVLVVVLPVRETVVLPAREIVVAFPLAREVLPAFTRTDEPVALLVVRRVPLLTVVEPPVCRVAPPGLAVASVVWYRLPPVGCKSRALVAPLLVFLFWKLRSGCAAA